MIAALLPPPAVEVREIRPQAGPQENFLSSSADITIAGGAAGVGKTYALTLEPLRHHENGKFDAVIFRRTTKQVEQAGGLWATAGELYPPFGASSNEQDLIWRFPSGASIKFAHMEHAKNRFDWDGSQIAMLGFDQLEGFEEIQFWYMLSRLRSVSGVRPYVRATCNPVPEDDPTGGWLAKLISWWIDPETGYPIWERSGVVRWMARINEVVEWADTREALLARFPGMTAQDLDPLSFTFIPGTLMDNRILMSKDPGYRAKLLSLPLVERERLLGGNWKVKATAGKVFNRAWFRSLKARPAGGRRTVRYWDKAGTEDGGKYSAGVRLSVAVSATDPVPIAIEHVERGQWSALGRETVILQKARADGAHVDVWVEQEPGSGGKESAESTVRNLGGFTIRVDRVTGDKIVRAGPLSAQAEAGNVYLVDDGTWDVEAFLREAHAFEQKAMFKDQIDAATGGYNKVMGLRPAHTIPVTGA